MSVLPKYQREGIFYQRLQSSIKAALKDQGKDRYANRFWYIKAWIFLGTYVLSYAALLNFGANPLILFTCYAVLGLMTVLIGLNIGHDAAHYAISKRRWVNDFFLRVFDLVGANSYLWKIRHVHAHHPFTNILGHDLDIKQSPLVRIFPADEVKSVHRWQHYYTPILLVTFYTMNWLLIRDFLDFSQKQFGNKRIERHPISAYVQLVFFKALFVFNLIVLPMLILPNWYLVIAGFFVMNVFAGMVISVALVSAHVGDHQEFPLPDENGNLPYSWAEHQLKTTSDFCTNSPLLNFCFGGFNHHVFHHLLPMINHIHYPKLTPILIEVAEKYNMPYVCEQSIGKVFNSHLRLLKREGLEHWLTQDEW